MKKKGDGKVPPGSRGEKGDGSDSDDGDVVCFFLLLLWMQKVSAAGEMKNRNRPKLCERKQLKN